MRPSIEVTLPPGTSEVATVNALKVSKHIYNPAWVKHQVVRVRYCPKALTEAKAKQEVLKVAKARGRPETKRKRTDARRGPLQPI